MIILRHRCAEPARFGIAVKGDNGSKERHKMSAEKNLKLEGMTCGHCVMSVTKQLQTLPGAKDVTVDLATQSAHLFTDDSVTEEQLAEAIDEAGYKLVSVS